MLVVCAPALQVAAVLWKGREPVACMRFSVALMVVHGLGLMVVGASVVLPSVWVVVPMVVVGGVVWRRAPDDVSAVGVGVAFS